MNKILAILLLFVSFSTVSGQSPDATTLNDTIKEIVVTAKSPSTTSISRYGENVTLLSSNLGKHAKILGTADALKYIQLLPGVKTNNDYTTGTSIQGCEFSHTIVDMAGATLFYPYHLMGIFSSCNSDHFPQVTLEKSTHSASFANRLGGKIALQPHNALPDKLSGSADAGLISSGMSLSIPVSDKCGLYLSGRLSYLNLLYSSFLEDDDNSIKYDFYDTNLTFLYKHDSNNTLSINTLYGHDKLDCLNKESFLDMAIGWHNLALSASWEHIGKISHKSTVTFSHFKNDLEILMTDFEALIPSKVMQASAKEDIKLDINKKLALNAGINIDYYRVRENGSRIKGLASEKNTSESYDNAVESKIYSELTYKISKKWQLDAGARATSYNTNGYNHFAIDPAITLRHQMSRDNTFTLHAGSYHQYIHQTGFSDNGMPTDFWFLTNNELKQQKAYSISAAWKGKIKPINTDITAEIYYKRMYDQPEFRGSILNMLDDSFNAASNIINSRGLNTGIDIMLQKQFGKISGWLSYSLGFARRKIPEITQGYVPSSRESLHNLSATVDYKFNPKWTFSANFVYASGAPTTPIKSIFMIGENVMCEYGDFNSWNLPSYHRLDLSATYNISHKKDSKYKQSVNFSIVNAYANKNVMLQYFSYWKETSTFRYKEVSTLFRILPSISYRIEF